MLPLADRYRRCRRRWKRAMRIYNGKPMVELGEVGKTGDPWIMVFPLVKKYGGVVQSD